MTAKLRCAMGWRDVLIWVIATLVALFFAGTLEEVLIPVVLLASVVILVLRLTAPRPGAVAADDQDGRLAELEERVRFLEDDHDRMVELEERVDFAERLLARRREEEQLAPPRRHDEGMS